MISTYGDNDGLTPDQIRHGLDDRQAFLWVGHYRLASSVTASDDELTADLILADKLAAEAAFMASDIRGLLERRAAERQDAENEAHEQHAEPGAPVIPCLSADHHPGHTWNDGALYCPGFSPGFNTGDRRALIDDMTREAVEEGTYDQPAPDVLVAGDALADLPADAPSDLGDKEGAFERYVETTAAEHKRAREAGEDR